MPKWLHDQWNFATAVTPQPQKLFSSCLRWMVVRQGYLRLSSQVTAAVKSDMFTCRTCSPQSFRHLQPFLIALSHLCFPSYLCFCTVSALVTFVSPRRISYLSFRWIWCGRETERGKGMERWIEETVKTSLQYFIILRVNSSFSDRWVYVLNAL